VRLVDHEWPGFNIEIECDSRQKSVWRQLMKLILHAPELGEEREQRATIASDADVIAKIFDPQGYSVYSLTNENVQREVHKGYTIGRSCWISGTWTIPVSWKICLLEVCRLMSYQI
jgi:hypothetical protein